MPMNVIDDGGKSDQFYIFLVSISSYSEVVDLSWCNGSHIYVDIKVDQAVEQIKSEKGIGKIKANIKTVEIRTEKTITIV